LQVDAEPVRPTDITWREWEAEGLSLDGLRNVLEEQPATLAVAGVPDARVADALIGRDLIVDPQGPATAQEIRAAIDAQRPGAINPEDLWELGDTLGYAVRIAPAGLRH